LLWVARLYALWVLGFRLMHFVSYSREPDTVVVTQFAHPAHTTGNISTVITHHGPTVSLFVEVLLFACLTFGLLMVHRQVGRIMVGAAATCVLSMTIYNVLHLLYMLASANSISVAFLHITLPLTLLSCVFTVAFQSVNICLALRPPGQSNNIDCDNLPPFASPQSS